MQFSNAGMLVFDKQIRIPPSPFPALNGLKKKKKKNLLEETERKASAASTDTEGDGV